MLDLESAIKHCEEVAEANEKESKLWEGGVTEAFKQKEQKLCECAKDHRQLAEWLKELKAYKANREGYCNWCSNLKDRHLRIEYYWIDDEGNTASYVGKTNQVATGIARFCPCCGRFIEMEVNADDT